jgi:hypothetical protein
MTEPGPELAEGTPKAVIGPSKTPLFQSIHAARYQRQALIKAGLRS